MTLAECLTLDELARSAGVQNPALRVRRYLQSAKRGVSNLPALPAGSPRHLLSAHKYNHCMGQVVSRAHKAASHQERISRKARTENHENDPPAHHFECLHDLCLVWPPEVPHFRSLESDSGELGHRFFRVLLPGPGESHRLV